MLRCSGDEDRCTQGRRRRAFARARKAKTDVVVELSELEFADASLMLDFVMLARRLRACERVLLLRHAQPQIRRLIELVGLDRMAGVRLDDPWPSVA